MQILKNSKRNLWKALWLALGILTMSFVLPTVTKADPPSWAPAHGYYKHHHSYRYYYYPHDQVYYSPVERRYYWQDGTNWTYGNSVPSTINLGRHVSVNLGGTPPYTYHDTVIHRYPVTYYTY